MKHFDLKAISPDAGPQFSYNVFAWLRKWRKNHGQESAELPVVWRDPNSVRFVGFMHEGSFIGSRLSAIQAEGARAQVFSYDTLRLTPIIGFWQKYKKTGWCALDSKHNLDPRGKRWSSKTRSRTCNWCGLQQKKISKRVTVTHWVNVR